MLNRVLRNWPYKLLALALALLLWNHVQNVKNPATEAPIKVSIRHDNLAKGYVATVIPDELPITLQGPKLQVDGIDPKKDVTASVDLAGLDVGTHKVAVKVSMPPDRQDTVTAQLGAKEVAVTIDSVSARTAPIEVKMKNPPPIGWTLNEPTIVPGSAEVSGKSGLVNSVSRLVAIIDASPVKPSVDDNFALRALDSRGSEVRGVKLTPDSARVALRLVEAPANKSVFVSPSVTGQPQFPYRVTKVTVEPSSITIKGRLESLVGATTISTDDVDVSGATATVTKRASLHVPPGLSVEGSQTVKVTIRVEQGPGH